MYIYGYRIMSENKIRFSVAGGYVYVRDSYKIELFNKWLSDFEKLELKSQEDQLQYLNWCFEMTDY